MFLLVFTGCDQVRVIVTASQCRHLLCRQAEARFWRDCQRGIQTSRSGAALVMSIFKQVMRADASVQRIFRVEVRTVPLGR